MFTTNLRLVVDSDCLSSQQCLVRCSVLEAGVQAMPQGVVAGHAVVLQDISCLGNGGSLATCQINGVEECPANKF